MELVYVYVALCWLLTTVAVRAAVSCRPNLFPKDDLPAIHVLIGVVVLASPLLLPLLLPFLLITTVIGWLATGVLPWK